jgi:dihydropteroate synthase
MDTCSFGTKCLVKLQLKQHTLQLEPGAPLIMGIVNIGDDSVADSRSLRTLDTQIEFALLQRDSGAQIIDIGVQSGRTDTPIIPEEEEIEQLLPLVSALAQEDVIVSVDTWRGRVAEAVLTAGAALINDVSGLADPALAELAGASGAALLVMHTRAPPKEEYFPDYEDPMADVLHFLDEQIDLAVGLGVARDQIIIDPGLDFAKTPEESIVLLRRLVELRRFNRPILLAVSRKYFIGMVTGKGPEERLAGTLAAVDFGLRAGAHIVRVHDVAEVAEFLRLRFALYHDGTPELMGRPEEEALKWLPPK